MRHVPPPIVKGGLGPRLASLFFGLVVCAVGIVLLLQAGLGLAPWDVLHQGIAERTPLSFGMANVVAGVVVLLVAWRLGARIGFGTVANATVIGACVQLLLSTGAIPDAGTAPLGERVGYLAAGIAGFGIGSAFYIGANMGAGPRDSLMLVVALRLHTRLGLARAGIELAVLAAGWALGGEVGVGTVAFALLIGPAIELAFYVLDRSPLARPSRLPAGSAKRGTHRAAARRHSLRSMNDADDRRPEPKDGEELGPVGAGFPARDRSETCQLPEAEKC